METFRFDQFTRLFGRATARRRLLAGLAVSPLLGLVAARLADVTEAKKKRRKRKKAKKPKPNEFGCLNVGQACGGDDSKCCSGICEGTKPKKGKKDTSRCVAHDAGTCVAERDLCTQGIDVFCELLNPSCRCFRTTGNAAFCGDIDLGLAGLCRTCSQDMECEAEFGPGAACVPMDGFCGPACPGTGTACIPRCPDPVPA